MIHIYQHQEELVVDNMKCEYGHHYPKEYTEKCSFCKDLKETLWECSNCSEIVKSDTQPYCKTCMHIERYDKKMVKI